MIQVANMDERHAIPRWNALPIAAKLGELNSCEPDCDVRQYHDSNIEDLLGEWFVGKNLPLAIEIISENQISPEKRDIGDVLEYARKTIAGMNYVPDCLTELVNGTDNIYDKIIHSATPSSDEIRILRQKLVLFPRNPLLWVELGRIYLILGEIEKSERAVKAAYSIAPNNRTTLRAIARFYAHQRDYDKALSYLRKADSLVYDPWILSAEISISNESGKTSRYVKTGQRLLESKKFSPHTLSELGSELATLDFFSANSKQGKRKLLGILEEPHENAVAQIVWLNDHYYKIPAIVNQIAAPDYNYEADSMTYYRESNYSAAAESAKAWRDYQPFSGAPLTMASYVLCDFLQDYQEAIDIISPVIHNFQNRLDLLNNYAYALIMVGRLEDASQMIKKAKAIMQGDDSIAVVATEGLWLYRTGCQQSGYEKYQDAIMMAKKENNIKSIFELYLHLAREEKRQGKDISQLMSIINSPKFSVYSDEFQTMIHNFDLE